MRLQKRIESRAGVRAVNHGLSRGRRDGLHGRNQGISRCLGRKFGLRSRRNSVDHFVHHGRDNRVQRFGCRINRKLAWSAVGVGTLGSVARGTLSSSRGTETSFT